MKTIKFGGFASTRLLLPFLALCLTLVGDSPAPAKDPVKEVYDGHGLQVRASGYAIGADTQQKPKEPKDLNPLKSEISRNDGQQTGKGPFLLDGGFNLQGCYCTESDIGNQNQPNVPKDLSPCQPETALS